jgi:hypothetical protein
MTPESLALDWGSADESVPPPSTHTTVLEQFDEESGIFWSLIDEQTIEVNLPD